MNNRYLCCGSRNWTNKERIREVMSKFPDDTIIIEGGARGADTMCGDIAKELGLEVIVFPANWKLFGKAAGAIRNKQMLDEEKPDKVFAFSNDLPNSIGTRNMVSISAKAFVPCYIVTDDTIETYSLPPA